MAHQGGSNMQRYRDQVSKPKTYSPSSNQQNQPNPNAIAPITSRGAEQNMVGEGASTQLIAAGATLQRAQTEFFTAIQVQVPRNKHDVIARVEDEMSLAPDRMLYEWEVKNKHNPDKPSVVSGPSVKMSNSIVAEYGNCIQRAKLVSETNTHWLIDGEFVDLERGVMTVRQFRQRKDQGSKSAKYDDERALDIAFQIGQSKAMRNAVMNGIPQSIVERAIKTVRKALAQEAIQEAGGVDKAKVAMVSALARYGVTQKMIETRLKKPIAEWTEANIADMRIVFTSLRDGDITVDKAFPSESKQAEQSDVKNAPPPSDDLEIPDWNTLTGEAVKSNETVDPVTGEVLPGGNTSDDDLPE